MVHPSFTRSPENWPQTQPARCFGALIKVAFVLPSEPLELIYYVGGSGRSPFEDWFNALDQAAAARVVLGLERLSRGNVSNVRPVGEGVLEYRINWGPGYRVYFGRDGAALVVLLMGGTKQRQQRDIAAARRFWTDYKQRRAREGGMRRLWH